VTLRGYRDAEPTRWDLARAPWRITVRPFFQGESLRWFERAQGVHESAEGEAVAAAWSELGGWLEAEGSPIEAAWAFLKSSEVLARAKRPKESLAALRRAHGAAEKSGDLEARFVLCEKMGIALKDRGEFEEAGALGEREKDLALEGWGSESLPYAQALWRLGTLAWARRDLDAARPHHEGALAIRERLAPGSLSVAESLTGLGQVAFSGAKLDEAGRFFAGAISLQEALVPGSLEMAKSLSNLGVVARNLGELEEAEGYAERALDLQTRLSPGSLAVANSLTTLGLIAHERGDLEKAELCHRQALEIRETKAPGGSAMAGSLNNLAGVAESRGDLEQAVSWYRRAVVLMEKLAPESLDLAACYSNLGNALSAKRDRRGALEAYRKTFAIEGKVAPGSIVYAGNFVNFGQEARRAGDLTLAEKHLKEAVSLYEKVAPGTLNQADALYFLSQVYRDKGDPKSREACLSKAAEISTNLAPGSLREAQCLRDLGSLYAGRGEPRQALGFYERAMASLECQTERLGGTFESRCAFREATYGTYNEALAVLMSMGRKEEAFSTLERSRSRIQLAMLSERDPDLGEEVPPELAKARRRLLREQERLQGDLAERTPGGDAKKGEAARVRLAEVRARLASMRAAIRKESPRYAAHRDPVPMTLQEVRAALPRDTVLLEFSIGRKRSTLFVLVGGTGEFRAIPIGAGEGDLGRRVEAFRQSIKSFKGARGDGPLRSQAAALYSLLLAPAEAISSKGSRLLVVPDGPLFGLPFGALVRGDGGYVAAWKPLRIAPSATLALSGSKDVGPGSEGTLAAFGDPSSTLVTGPAVPGNPEGGGKRTTGVLPSARLEVIALKDLFGTGAKVFIGPEATKKKVFEEASKAGYLHFACHGTLDPDFPLSSSLVLAPSPGKGKENKLQAWEVFERLRTRATLTTLSACESGLGKAYDGEGVLGLVQAFRYAGARSVVASLWQIGDECTAVFMGRFYSYLKAGLSKDEALQKVQTDFIRASSHAPATGQRTVPPYASAPYFWAAFQLYGDS
jgi:CHAT domain-containing protein/Tfp pilus assembly protein PilF